MAPFKPGFAAFQLINLETGIPLYRTCATEDEILEANRNLRARGLPSRFIALATAAAQALAA